MLFHVVWWGKFLIFASSLYYIICSDDHGRNHILSIHITPAQVSIVLKCEWMLTFSHPFHISIQSSWLVWVLMLRLLSSRPGPPLYVTHFLYIAATFTPCMDHLGCSIESSLSIQGLATAVSALLVDYGTCWLVSLDTRASAANQSCQLEESCVGYADYHGE